MSALGAAQLSTAWGSAETEKSQLGVEERGWPGSEGRLVDKHCVGLGTVVLILETITSK